MAMVLMTAQLHAATVEAPDSASSVVSPVPAGPVESELLLHIKALEEVAAQLSGLVGPATASIASHDSTMVMNTFNPLANILNLSGDLIKAAPLPTWGVTCLNDRTEAKTSRLDGFQPKNHIRGELITCATGLRQSTLYTPINPSL